MKRGVKIDVAGSALKLVFSLWRERQLPSFPVVFTGLGEEQEGIPEIEAEHQNKEEPHTNGDQ